GLPAAGSVQRAIESAIASPVLPRSTKVLMIAVVARSLECRHCETEMRVLLEQAGLSAAEMEVSVRTLTAPKGDPDAQALIEFAPDTVRYQPQEIQRHTRELLKRIGPERTLEAVGVAALANAVVRVAMLLE